MNKKATEVILSALKKCKLPQNIKLDTQTLNYKLVVMHLFTGLHTSYVSILQIKGYFSWGMYLYLHYDAYPMLGVRPIMADGPRVRTGVMEGRRRVLGRLWKGFLLN